MLTISKKNLRHAIFFREMSLSGVRIEQQSEPIPNLLFRNRTNERRSGEKGNDTHSRAGHSEGGDHRVSTAVPSPASSTEALGMLRAALGFLSAADATQMAAEEQAQCLQALERFTSMSTAARASILGAFISGQGYSAGADYSPRSWLIHRTRVTKGAAAAHTAWARRAAAHPRVAAALAEGDMSESYARTACEWSDKLPGDCRDAADAILVAAALAGADLTGLAELAAEIYARSLPDTSDGGPDESFEDRSLRLETTFDGAGVISGDLTPECAAVVTASV
jgi:hypothetical protein